MELFFSCLYKIVMFEVFFLRPNWLFSSRGVFIYGFWPALPESECVPSTICKSEVLSFFANTGLILLLFDF